MPAAFPHTSHIRSPAWEAVVAGLIAATLALPGLAAPQEPLRVFLRAGPKTHGEGEHDHPRFLEEWRALLGERGCQVQGALRFPTAAELAQSDVLVCYAAENGSIHGAERAALEQFLARGGGLVVIHDAVCGDDPQWFKTIAGGAWEHGHSKWQEGLIGLYFDGEEHPITRGAANFDFDDEIYWDLHLAPEARVLAHGFHTPFDVTPQMWVYEPGPYRAFVSIQGHNSTSFAHPAWRTLLLRGIAWAARRDADLLVTPEEITALRYPPGGPLAPEAETAALVPEQGFKVELVAAEPLVAKPISLDWDARGRMWVALTPGYPFKQESSGIPAHDEVVILADEDGDGRMDARTVFADELDLVTSLVLWRDGVIVSQSPEILFLRDTDGDDHADERVTLFKGFGYKDTHAVVSNLRWGLDGWIYATQGYSGRESRHVTNAAGQDFGYVPNGLFRFRPDGSAIETVSAYSDNTWGLDFAPDGELYFTMANGSHLRHVVLPESVLSRARLDDASTWREIVDHERVFQISKHERSVYKQIDFVGGFTAAAGCLIYDGGTWPAEFAGNHFVSEPTVNLVHRDVIAPAGVSYRASRPPLDREQEFLASADPWFRPVHARVGPDGNIYVLDFYNQAAVHNDTRGPQHGPTNAAVRPDRDHVHGRIWRVRHIGAERLAVPDLANASEGDLVAHLKHPNAWVRGTAQRLLVENASLEDIGPALSSFFDLLGPGKVHALWIAQQLGDGVELSEQGLQDSDAALRKNAASVSALLPPADSLRKLVVACLGDADRRVRVQALATLSTWSANGAPPAVEDSEKLTALWPTLEDPVERAALLGALPADATTLAVALLSARSEALVLELVERIARTGDAAQITQALSVLSRAESAAPETLAGALRRLEERTRELTLASETVSEPLTRLLEREELEVAIAALPLAARWGGPALAPQIEASSARLCATLEDVEQPGSVRLRALETLLALQDWRELAIAAAQPFLDPQEHGEVQLAAIEELGAVPEPAVADLFVSAWPTLGSAARDAVFEQLVQRPERLAPLLDAIAAEEISANDLGPYRVHRLRTHADADVARRANALLARGGSADVEQLIAGLLPVVESPGDALNGRKVFEANCATCHAIDGTGPDVGPDLAGMGTHGARELLPFIVDPNRVVEAAFVEYVARKNDGTLVAGVLKRESPDSILLAGADGKHEVRREDLAELRSTGRSPMPTGFEALGAEALRDLLTYLSGGFAGFRVLDLRLAMSASRERSMYDPEHENLPMRFTRHGIVDVEGVPFEVLDHQRFEKNVLVLKGGMRDDWDSKTTMPQSVDVPVGFALARVHVLGGIAAWGWPFTKNQAPIVRWTWHYSDGTSEEVLLRDGTEFSDWIGRRDVPGSTFVPLLAPDSPGQVRTFSLVPGRDVAIDHITLASFDNYAAPTFVALTAELPGALRATPAAAPAKVLIVGGGTSHDYERWFRDADLATLAAADLGPAAYTDRPGELAQRLQGCAVLVLTNNQPIPAEVRPAIDDFVTRGGGLVLLHAATWFNWPDWPEYNRELVGGGAKSHEDYGTFDVARAPLDHPLLSGVPATFTVEDELYRFEPATGSERLVLAEGHSRTSGKSYPVVYTLQHGQGRVVAITLGHDGAAHGHPAFQRLLVNAVTWLSSE